MDHYRSYFLNAASRIIGTASFPAPNLAAALNEAQRLLIEHDYRVAAELWRDDQYVGCVLRGDPVTDEAAPTERLAKCPLLRKAS
jgi:hypothetical protein